MSAELLRKAAAVLRERANAATPSPWERNGRNAAHTDNGSCVYTTAQYDDTRRRCDADYIAMMHPGVGLALADWLDLEAATRTEMEPFVELINVAIEKQSGVSAYLRFGRSADGSAQMQCDTMEAAVELARLIVGEQ